MEDEGGCGDALLMINGGLFFSAIDGVEAVILTTMPPLNADAAD